MVLCIYHISNWLPLMLQPAGVLGKSAEPFYFNWLDAAFKLCGKYTFTVAKIYTLIMTIGLCDM